MSIHTGIGARPLGDIRPTAKPVSWSICVIAFFSGNVLLWADRSNFSVAAAAWSKDYHWTPGVMGLMLSAFSLGYLVMQPFGGWIGDRLGPRKIFALTCSTWSLAELLTPLAPALLWVTALFRGLLGIAEAPFIPSIGASVSKAIPEEKRRAGFNAIMQSGAQLGPAAGVFFAALILRATHAPAMVFVIFAAVGFAFAAIWWLYAMNRSDPAPRSDSAESAEGRARVLATAVPWTTLLTTRSLWPLYIGYFALPYCQYIFLAWLPQYLTHYRHIELVQAGMLSALPFLAAFVANNVTGQLMNWMSAKGWRQGDVHRKLFIYIGAITYATCTMIAATTSSTSLAVWMIVIANAGLAGYAIPFWTIVTDIAPQQSGTLGGFMNFFGILGATISPAASGFIAQATHAFVAPLEVAAGIMVVAALVAALFLRVRPLGKMVADGALPA